MDRNEIIKALTVWGGLTGQGRVKQISLARNENFSGKPIMELPICFDGTIAECVDFALAEGCVFVKCDRSLFGGAFEHPTEAMTLYPV